MWERDSNYCCRSGVEKRRSQKGSGQIGGAHVASAKSEHRITVIMTKRSYSQFSACDINLTVCFIADHGLVYTYIP